jgi:hypothetical protein
VLKAQHHRGREVTEYTLALTGNGAIGSGDAEPLARAMESFVLTKTMPRARTRSFSRPGKRLFPSTSCTRYATSSRRSSARNSARSATKDAVAQIGRIEQTLGLADLAQSPPHRRPRHELPHK